MAETTDRKTGKNLICFGAPGTGKSHSMTKQMESIYKANGVTNPTNLLELPEAVGIRTTFHPDSDYSTFVGCYKPRTTANHQIEYHFQPQAFVNAYVNAWCTNKPYFLVIEEINRGNCAQIFGDLFQVLDRKPDGEHEYSIKPDADLRDCIKEEFKNKKIPEDCVIPRDIKEGKILYLPKNLTLLATMNTSDQSLFPMDSAFKRRWEWCYMPITAGNKARKIKIIKEINEDTFYSWWEFIQKVNERIYKVTKSEDKKIGYWFVKVNDDDREPISADLFVNKVLFYLWSDVFKDYGEATGSPFALKNGEKTKFVTYQQLFNDNGTLNTNDISQLLGENGLGLKELSKNDECKDDPYEKDNEEKQSEEAIDEGKTENSSDDKVEPVELVDSTVYDSLPSGEGPGWSVATSFVDKKAYEVYTVEQLMEFVQNKYYNKFNYKGSRAIITFLNKKDKEGNLLQITDTGTFKHLFYFVLSIIDINSLDLLKAGITILKPGEEKGSSRCKPLKKDDKTKYGFNGKNNDVIKILSDILEQLLEKKQYKDLFVISKPIKEEK